MLYKDLKIEQRTELLVEMGLQKTPTITGCRVMANECPIECAISFKNSQNGLKYWLKIIGGENAQTERKCGFRGY